jgi:hypothetical protein
VASRIVLVASIIFKTDVHDHFQDGGALSFGINNSVRIVSLDDGRAAKDDLTGYYMYTYM